MINLDNVGNKLLFTTVFLSVENVDGTKTSGTGFIYSVKCENDDSLIPFLVTNNHVIDKASRVIVEFIESKDGKPNPEAKVSVEIEGSVFRNYVKLESDLSVVPIGSFINECVNNNKPIFRAEITPELIPEEDIISKLGAIEEVIFIGYPSGIYDHENFSPIVRKGITASPIWNNFKGKPRFLIDAGVFPGSSGSPVFIYNEGSYASNNGIAIGTRVFFIGIITGTMIRQEAETSKFFLNLGDVIKSSELKSFVSSIVKQM